MKKSIAFRSNEHSSSSCIEKLEIIFSDTDKENIKKSIKILKENAFISHLRIDINGSITYFDDENIECGDDEWRVDVEQFIVYTSAVYYYAQSKWDCSDYIESGEININEILE